MALTEIKTSGIADDAITADKLANAINTERAANTAKVSLGSDAVTGAKIADDAIDSEHYTDGSIDTAHIADNQVTGDKLADDITLAGTLTLPDTITHTGDTNTKIRFPAADTVSVETGGSERARITSAGEVIINDTAKVADSLFGIKVDPSTHNGIGFKPTSNGSFGALRTINAAGNEVCNIQYDTTNANINFRTSNTEKLRIDSSGRLGINKTPAAYHSNNKGVIVGDGGYALYGRGTDTMILSQNHYYDGSDVGKYIADGAGTFYQQVGGVHKFFTAGSGSADAGISLSEKVRIQNGGGISFNGDTAAANALDDYEEGLFTPRIGPNNDDSTYESGEGSYTKIGRQVTVHIHFQNKNPNSFGQTAEIRIWNLPFTVRHSDNDGSNHYVAQAQMMYNIQFGGSERQCFYTSNNATQLVGLKSRDGLGWTSWTCADFDTNSFYLNTSLTYQTT